MQKLSASFFILVASISYGSLGIVAKFAYAQGVSPSMLALFQMFFGVVFFALLKPQKLTSFFKIPKKTLLLLGLGGSMSALTAYFYYASLGVLSASTAIIMLFQFVWIGLALELWHKKRIPSKSEILSVFLCYVGTYLSVGMQDGSVNFYGLFLGFLSGMAFAVYIFFSSTLCLEEDSDTRAFWIIMSAFISIFVLSIFDLELTNLAATLKWGSICGILGVLIPFYIYAVFSPRIGAGATSLIGSAELPSALLLSMVFLGEKLDGFQIIGSVLVLFAIFIVFLAEAKAK